jgi:hypothetical protein
MLLTQLRTQEATCHAMEALRKHEVYKMNIDENTLLKMLNPRYKDLFELVAKRGIDEIQRDNPELIEQIHKELELIN